MTTTKDRMIQVKKEHEQAIEKANVALNSTPVDYEAYNGLMNDIGELEKEYAKLASITMYDEYAQKDNPIIEIIKAWGYDVIGHKENREKDDARVASVTYIEKTRRVDLLEFCKRAKLDTAWNYKASKANQLVCMRVAHNVGADLNVIAKTYAMDKIAKGIEMGETPDSKTQVCKLLQQVIDAMLPNEDDNGKKIYKVNAHDVGYLDNVYGKWSKERLTIKVANDSVFRRILFDIAYRLVTNSKYSVDGYKVLKQEE